ncbi:hypothetical protein GUI26_34305 [Escherichia coli]|nr:hypothetical protein [Escherichia coli]
MLKTISPLISPELLKVLAEMGHGDEIIFSDAETTVAGAALFGWYGVGEFNSPEEARAQIHYQYRYFYPQTEPEFIEEV